MKIFVCPRDWTHATDRFTPDCLLSLQDPDADLTGLRPEWISAENHHVVHFFDIDNPTDPFAPTRDNVQAVIDWLQQYCGPGSEARIIIHCDAGLGRSPAAAYIAWGIHLGPGREQEAFDQMKDSCLDTQVMPNSVVVAHADEILGRKGALKKPLTEWNKRVRWSRTLR